ncbi:hypothetical protein C3477_10200 [Mycobacterium kansasii]|nr:hypothetical protein C3B43_28250 [Mycobacterium kansasii]POY06500.1 hypothetical protein C3477_10200 [Mycobacterium kansasii]POY12061.1 hypothetical protein C3476_28140 [Mycobacterium kansasii]
MAFLAAHRYVENLAQLGFGGSYIGRVVLRRWRHRGRRSRGGLRGRACCVVHGRERNYRTDSGRDHDDEKQP